MAEITRRAVAVLGSTGSVGVQTLDLITRLPGRFEVVALAAGRNVDLLASQIETHRPRLVAVTEAPGDGALKEAARRARCEIVSGAEGLLAAATCPAAEIVVAAVVGAAGLPATHAALEAGKTVALANKESLVMAGEFLRATARRTGGQILPVDSEHSAVHQCLRGSKRGDLARVILTASGGPFRTTPLEDLPRVTPEQALRHPIWTMGKKISIDSATLMNKGLEVIEARWLFDLEPEQVGVVLHPQGLVHSLVEMVDGSVLCQVGAPDMRGPIQYALGYPERFPGPVKAPDLAQRPPLEFFPVEARRFPSLDLAYRALRAGGTAPSVLNAANEVAVDGFLSRRLDFPGIPRLVGAVMDRHRPSPATSLESVLQADAWARGAALELMSQGGAC
jgi:1-deoxy-D-xylulose-5-phosphate reductoisomerase